MQLGMLTSRASTLLAGPVAGNRHMINKDVPVLSCLRLQLLNNTLKLASDVYSFGVIMYELLTFKIPFEGLNKEQVGAAAAAAGVHIWWLGVTTNTRLGSDLHQQAKDEKESPMRVWSRCWAPPDKGLCGVVHRCEA
jgi:serine/threonine protein kinase